MPGTEAWSLPSALNSSGNPLALTLTSKEARTGMPAWTVSTMPLSTARSASNSFLSPAFLKWTSAATPPSSFVPFISPGSMSPARAMRAAMLGAFNDDLVSKAGVPPSEAEAVPRASINSATLREYSGTSTFPAFVSQPALNAAVSEPKANGTGRTVVLTLGPVRTSRMSAEVRASSPTVPSTRRPESKTNEPSSREAFTWSERMPRLIDIGPTGAGEFQAQAFQGRTKTGHGERDVARVKFQRPCITEIIRRHPDQRREVGGFGTDGLLFDGDGRFPDTDGIEGRLFLLPELLQVAGNFDIFHLRADVHGRRGHGRVQVLEPQTEREELVIETADANRQARPLVDGLLDQALNQGLVVPDEQDPGHDGQHDDRGDDGRDPDCDAERFFHLLSQDVGPGCLFMMVI